MTDHYLRKYGVATTIDFQLYKLDGTGLKVDAASATHDIKIMKDEGNEADTTADAFVDEGQGYSLALTATEMEAARIVIYIVDLSSPQVWLDKTLIIETYGHASAQHIFDLGTATQNVNISSTNDIDFSATQKTSLDTIGDTVITNSTIHTDVATLQTDVTAIKKVNINKWAIVGTQLIIYDDNKVDVLYTFNLDSATNPSSRTPV